MSHTKRIALIYVLTIVASLAFGPRTAICAVTILGDVTTGSSFIVGNQSFGSIRVDGGSTYTVTANSPVIGQSAVGIATVTGAGSQMAFTSSNGLDVGSGRLEILNGAYVNIGTNQSNGTLDIAPNSFTQGTVVVDGVGSLLTCGAVNLGPTSGSTPSNSNLQLTNSASVYTGTMTISTGGRLDMSNGLIRTSQFTTNSGVVVGSGELALLATNLLTNNGRIEADAAPLRLTGPIGVIQNNGIIAAEGGALEFNRTITNNISGTSAAEVTLRNGIVRAGLLATSGAQLTNSAVLAALGGTNDFYGRVTNTSTGSIAVTNHSVLIFHDDVTADGGTITVFPGSSAIFLEDLTMNPGSKLLANLAGTNQNTGFGDAEVVGVATLAGTVGASLAAGYTPHAGDSFPLVAASSLSGSLGLGDMPALPAGLKWDLDTDANRVILTVVPGLAGDYNGNGTVDAADYVVWRKTLDQTGPNLAADGNSNGRVDAADLDFWRSRLGNPSGTGTSLATSIPEPGTFTLIFVGLALVVCRGRKLQW